MREEGAAVKVPSFLGRKLGRRVLHDLELTGIYLTDDQARVIAAVLRRSAPPLTRRETEIVTRFHMRVQELGPA